MMNTAAVVTSLRILLNPLDSQAHDNYTFSRSSHSPLICGRGPDVIDHRLPCGSALWPTQLCPLLLRTLLPPARNQRIASPDPHDDMTCHRCSACSTPQQDVQRHRTSAHTMIRLEQHRLQPYNKTGQKSRASAEDVGWHRWRSSLLSLTQRFASASPRSFNAIPSNFSHSEPFFSDCGHRM